MGLVLNMNPNWKQKITVFHGGEILEIHVQQTSLSRLRVHLEGPKSFQIKREPEEE